MTKITEKTWLPISLVSALGGAGIGGVIWLTTMYNLGVANASAITSIESKHEVLKDSLIEKLDLIHRDISELKTEIKRLNK